MPYIADRVKENSTTTGTGTYTLAGAAAGFRAFSAAFTNGLQVFYVAVDSAGVDWEIGIGTYSASTLTRDTIIASTNAGNAFSWASGTRTVFCDAPAIALQTLTTGMGTLLTIKEGYFLN
jgi:hypothetical protein